MTGVRRGILSELFTGAAAKALSAVEASPQRSNQHELNGASPLRRIFGTEDRRSVPTRFIWLGDEQEAISAEGSISWYDARRQHPTRSEYRLYYTTNPVTDLMQAGDHLFVALRNNGTAMVVVAPAATAVRNQLLWLFDLEATETSRSATSATSAGRSISPRDISSTNWASISKSPKQGASTNCSSPSAWSSRRHECFRNWREHPCRISILAMMLIAC